MDKDIPEVIRSPRFEHEDAVTGVGAESVGEDAAGRATTDDDGVVGDSWLGGWVISLFVDLLVCWLAHGVYFLMMIAGLLYRPVGIVICRIVCWWGESCQDEWMIGESLA